MQTERIKEASFDYKDFALRKALLEQRDRKEYFRFLSRTGMSGPVGRVYHIQFRRPYSRKFIEKVYGPILSEGEEDTLCGKCLSEEEWDEIFRATGMTDEEIRAFWKEMKEEKFRRLGDPNAFLRLLKADPS